MIFFQGRVNAIPDQDHCDDAALAGQEKGWHHGVSKLEPKLMPSLIHLMEYGLIPVAVTRVFYIPDGIFHGCGMWFVSGGIPPLPNFYRWDCGLAVLAL